MSLMSPTCVTTTEFAFELSAFNNNNNNEPTTCKREPADVDMDQANNTDDEDEETGTTVGTGVWTKDEHARFLEAIKLYANGPWKLVAAYVATRTVRQTMTHAQKYRQKAARRLRGLRTKQALMRMHYGHRLTEESLAQERMRALSAQVDAVAGNTSPQPLYSPAAQRAASALRNKQARQQQQQAQLATETTKPASPAGGMLALLKDPNPETSAQILSKKSISRGRKATTTTTRRHASKASKATPKTTEMSVVSGTIINTTQAIFSQATSATLDAAIYDLNELIPTDLEIIDDLSEAPSLEECADMLYDLLCC